MIGPVITPVVSTVLTALLAVPVAGPGVDPGNTGGGYGERASGYWKFAAPDDGSGQKFVFAEVYEGTNNAGPSAIAVVGIGTCATFERDDGPAETCRGAGLGHELAPEEFEVSPLLDVARLDFFLAGQQQQQVYWKATDDVPGFSPFYGIGRGGAAAEAKSQRIAGATGQILGLDIGDAVEQAALVSRGAGFGAGVTTSGDGSTFTRTMEPDGRVRVEITRPITR